MRGKRRKENNKLHVKEERKMKEETGREVNASGAYCLLQWSEWKKENRKGEQRLGSTSKSAGEW